MALKGMLCENADRRDSYNDEEHGYGDIEQSITSSTNSEHFCPICGKGNPEGSNFCIACGANLGSRVGRNNYSKYRELNYR